MKRDIVLLSIFLQLLAIAVFNSCAASQPWTDIDFWVGKVNDPPGEPLTTPEREYLGLKPFHEWETENIEWLGGITFTGVDQGFIGTMPQAKHPRQMPYYRSDIEIGIRSDGTVVWRKKP